MTRSQVVAVVGMCLLVASCGTPGRVIQQASPSPFSPESSFAVMPITYEDLRVGDKTDEEYAADKKDDTRWQDDKEMVSSTFINHLLQEKGITWAAPDAAEFRVVPRCSFIEPGFNVGVARKATRVEVTVDIVAKDGTLLDQVWFKPAAGGGQFRGYTVRDRLGHASRVLATEVGRYIRSRL
ncbi:MAG: hypothetical protein HY903_18140 [Deltaproteobacteria bacterium]|nr:hypothetical protein [Deltaproteobacteria bacterium]